MESLPCEKTQNRLSLGRVKKEKAKGLSKIMVCNDKLII